MLDSCTSNFQSLNFKIPDTLAGILVCTPIIQVGQIQPILSTDIGLRYFSNKIAVQYVLLFVVTGLKSEKKDAWGNI